MTFSQVQRATGDATIHALSQGTWIWNHWEDGQIVLVPSLGAVGCVGPNGLLTEISFKVRPVVVAPHLYIHHPFRGVLADVLSFEGGPVGRKDVEAKFGPIHRSATNITEAMELRERSQSFDWKGSGGKELLWYPGKGVAFEFESNILMSFRIYKAVVTHRGNPPKP